MHVMYSNVVVLAFCCIVQWLCEFYFVFRLTDQERKTCSHLSKSKSHRRRTSSRTDLLRCGNKDDNISMAFWDTSGDFDVDVTEDDSGFLWESSDDFASASDEPESSDLGSVTVMPKIFPGGKDSIVLPVSFDASLKAIASSTACCRLSATCE